MKKVGVFIAARWRGATELLENVREALSPQVEEVWQTSNWNETSAQEQVKGTDLIICLGGAIGTGARYAASMTAVAWLGTEFPYGTLIVNLAGAFAIGLVQQLSMQALPLSEDVRLFLTTGMVGGLTTYSAFTFETVRLVQVGAWRAAAANVVVTTTACLLLCILGMVVASALLSGR